MKLFFMLMIGLIDAKKKGGRKVPPRHPSSRLNRLVHALKRDLRDCAYFLKSYFSSLSKNDNKIYSETSKIMGFSR